MFMKNNKLENQLILSMFFHLLSNPNSEHLRLNKWHKMTNGLLLNHETDLFDFPICGLASHPLKDMLCKFF